MNILLTLDGSEFAESAIPAAQRLARTPGTEVHVLAVAEPSHAEALAGRPPGGIAAELGGDGVATLDAPELLPMDVEFILEHYLEAVARQFPNCVVKPVLRVGPHPAEQIAAYAEANGIDLIVMATHGRSGIGQFLHGSIAGRVLRAGVAPVVLVRPAMAAA